MNARTSRPVNGSVMCLGTEANTRHIRSILTGKNPWILLFPGSTNGGIIYGIQRDFEKLYKDIRGFGEMACWSEGSG